MQITTVVDDLVFPECLRWRKGRLWFVDMYDGRLCCVDSSGLMTTPLKRSTYLGGIAWGGDGSVLVIDKLAKAVLQIVDGHVSVFADISHLCSSKLNDAIALLNGDLIVGEYGFDVLNGEDFKPGRLYRISSDGHADIAISGLAFPNGMALGRRGETLYVAETAGQKISQFAVSNAGKLQDRKTLTRFDKGNPDGLCIDQDGSLWTALLGKRKLLKISPEGDILGAVELRQQAFDVVTGDSPDVLYVGVSSAVASDLEKTELPRTGSILRISL